MAMVKIKVYDVVDCIQDKIILKEMTAREIADMIEIDIHKISEYAKKGVFYQGRYQFRGYIIQADVCVPYKIRKIWAQMRAAADTIRTGEGHRVLSDCGELYVKRYDGRAIHWGRYL